MTKNLNNIIGLRGISFSLRRSCHEVTDEVEVLQTPHPTVKPSPSPQGEGISLPYIIQSINHFSLAYKSQ